MSFGCERSCSSLRKVSNFNSKVAQGGIYLHIKFERDRLNIFFELECLQHLGGRGRGGDAKTIISLRSVIKLWENGLNLTFPTLKMTF